jgi:hypothetical protein
LLSDLECEIYRDVIEKGDKEMLRMNKLYVLIACGISCFLFYAIAAHADERDQSTKMTFSEPVHLPGVTLPAGTYWFKLVDSPSDRDIVQIFNADRSVLYATELAMPTLRHKLSDNTVVTLAEQAPGEPDALLKWFYPSELTGHEFVYPAQKEQQLAQAPRQNIVVNGHAESGD